MNSLTKNEITVKSNEKAASITKSQTTSNVSNQKLESSYNNSNQLDKKKRK